MLLISDAHVKQKLTQSIDLTTIDCDLLKRTSNEIVRDDFIATKDH